ncbi:hypothetical protein HDV03_004198 [Kappamyces sp. JEL0829]|nr:hypothetical protein HDV03_004198 [Kappamyces sp. JEL0829]KAJ3337358.1 hypothetical protein HDU91_001508 [Kappamyces sp. JEL0680]
MPDEPATDSTSDSKPRLPSGPPTLKDVKINWEKITFQNIATMPCVKTSFINGLAALSIVSSSRYFATRRAGSALNYGMVAFLKRVAQEQLLAMQKMQENAASSK